MTNPYLPPPIETATDPVHSTADLGQRWRALMGPLGFGQRLIWFGFLGPDRRLIKALHQLPIPRRPREDVCEKLFGGLAVVVEELDAPVTVAILLTGPGTGGVSERDRRWAGMLTDFAQRCEVPLEPIFRANDESLELVEPSFSASVT
ncbi:hypothetical protein MCHIJ_40720 [Mycolicibacterium chitae]|uniref:Uncharacterized protein n=1 Tax=Mycolicibacterium chitae TaxID=1792 RepID=A0A448I7J9_MYCCI|nr:hypothetical protein [Mycolicibacterium chitae]MCV7105791.1 hypothetical protein [Mycolicibacterium chitae]BBZ04635.1 hypothetical protein MCHIJ_40720 [Mycolicibacterium chitae]VEG48265.1 Uncharacterised protein [Mycolicibacterium chitae]